MRIGSGWCLTAIGVALALISPAGAADHDALWRIVSTQCLPHYQAAQNPAPCAAVDTADGYAVLKDRNGAYQFLLIPTRPISGIEDPALLAPGAINYWQAAWQARRYVENALGHPLSRDRLSLAVNSRSGRSQDQLHIHIDCIGETAWRALRAGENRITAQWSSLSIAGHPYQVRRIEGETLDNADPFEIVAGTLPAAKQAMADYTIFVAGAVFADGKPGFYLLVDRAFSVPGDYAHAEELQDHNCSLAN
ncbi:MAG TPA: CDP-diacylglycerol diphosphatase [Burkholderiales bacterium]|nr:CDP-diacylglycerol diphosphatase [Burkholderiales bacterium]